VLWGGPKFDRISRFVHPGVTYIEFSPCDGYLISCSPPNKGEECIFVWDMATGLKRGFTSERLPGNANPKFTWSHDDKYFARIVHSSGKNKIMVYETPTFALLGKKSIGLDRVNEIQFSPSDNLLAYYVPEMKNQPAAVGLLEIPSRKQIREKHAYNITKVTMHWQEAGNYLCINMYRLKSKKTMVNNFEIFKIREKGVPVEMFQMTEKVVAFAWEPVGHRFGVIHGPSTRTNVSFYKIGKKIKLTDTMDGKAANCLFWSPTGDNCVIAGVGAPFNGQLEFYDVKHKRSMTETDHFMAADIEWDPSGRFVMTSVTQPIGAGDSWKYSLENGYRVWTFQGEQLVNKSMESLYQAMWRPRPASLLTIKEQRAIKRDLKSKYWAKFDAEDAKIKESVTSVAARAKQTLKEQWKQRVQRAKKTYLDERADRNKVRDGKVSDDEEDFVLVEQIIKETISVTEIEMD
jgi:translation initiation factor 3 subunit B